MIRCGRCEVDITPALGSVIPGYFYERKSTGVKDNLYAKALVIESAGRIVALVALDCLDLRPRIATGIRERISLYTGIPISHVMVSATHTHTGPPIIKTTFYEEDEVYLLWMVEKAADAAIAAYNGLQEAAIGYGAGQEASLAFNRRFYMRDGTVRTNPGIGHPLVDRSAGPIDPQVIVVRIDDAQGKPLGIITNYACHTDAVGGSEYSADYPGELSLHLRQAWGEELVSLFLMGASGNINHVDVLRTAVPGDAPSVDHYRQMGRILAEEVLRVGEQIAGRDRGGLLIDVRQAIVPVAYRTPDEAEVEAARQLSSRTRDESAAADPSSSIEANFARELLEAAVITGPSSAEIEIQVIRLGELAIVGLPAELFVELGLRIKEQSPFRLTLIGTLTNGSASGYICTKEAYREGGYEPLITSSSRLSENAGDMLVQHALELMNQLLESD